MSPGIYRLERFLDDVLELDQYLFPENGRNMVFTVLACCVRSDSLSDSATLALSIIFNHFQI